MKATGKMRGHTVRWQHRRLVRPSRARLAHVDTVRYLIIRIRMRSPVNIVSWGGRRLPEKGGMQRQGQVVVWPDAVATGKARLPTPMWGMR